MELYYLGTLSTENQCWEEHVEVSKILFDYDLLSEEEFKGGTSLKARKQFEIAKMEHL
ncbi:hypothetical protein [Rossellomorea aquimaris]|uniref:hypothetical protein n=1 Tax=Rossellomorea aquimaris TaxID=189382 RepID=UPI001653AFAC|nr:hypothetical protein [Rossellomorea aquimaris]